MVAALMMMMIMCSQAERILRRGALRSSEATDEDALTNGSWQIFPDRCAKKNCDGNLVHRKFTVHPQVFNIIYFLAGPHPRSPMPMSASAVALADRHGRGRYSLPVGRHRRRELTLSRL